MGIDATIIVLMLQWSLLTSWICLTRLHSLSWRVGRMALIEWSQVINLEIVSHRTCWRSTNCKIRDETNYCLDFLEHVIVCAACDRASHELYAITGYPSSVHNLGKTRPIPHSLMDFDIDYVFERISHCPKQYKGVPHYKKKSQQTLILPFRCTIGCQLCPFHYLPTIVTYS